MLSLPPLFAAVLSTFAPLFSRRVWLQAQVLLLGAILAPGKRTVTSCLRILGLSGESRFVNYHRVLSRARWSGRAASRLLLGLLVNRFAPTGPIVLGIDDTIERRRGKRIQAKGIYRDPVRSSHSHFVKASGLRWVSLMLLAPVPWAARPWASPFFTCLAPSERYRQKCQKRHKPVLDWARQMIFQVQRWLPDRALVVVGDSAFSALEWLHTLVRQKITVVTRLRLDAALYEPAPFRPAGTNGRPRKKGKRLATLRHLLHHKTTRWQRLTVPGWYGEGDRVIEICSRTAVWYHTGLPPVPIRWVLIRDPAQRFDPQALLCTDLTQSPLTIVSWFVRRWQVEVTFQEVRRALGVETQRQWADQAIARTTPCLLALFSLVTLLADRLVRRGTLPLPQDAWYTKRRPTFADALAAVRQHYWTHTGFRVSGRKQQMGKLSSTLRECLTYALCRAA
ncbi:MAG: transposase [Acidobacteriaceae bacterium]|nr:transposase [Acidobacteriaceae bacterium]